jgi:hypothetical protein
VTASGLKKYCVLQEVLAVIDQGVTAAPKREAGQKNISVAQKTEVSLQLKPQK